MKDISNIFLNQIKSNPELDGKVIPVVDMGMSSNHEINLDTFEASAPLTYLIDKPYELGQAYYDPLKPIKRGPFVASADTRARNRKRAKVAKKSRKNNRKKR